MLNRIGVDVETAENGSIALDKIRTRMPNIVLMDIRMPVMDGPDTLAQLFEEHGRDSVDVIAVTASVFDHERKRYLDMGFSGFVEKPLRAEQIYRCLADHLGVEYTYEESEVVGTAEESVKIVADDFKISPELYDRLISAAESYSITDLRDGLEILHEEAPRLAEYLDEYVRVFNMEKIKEVLEEIQT